MFRKIFHPDSGLMITLSQISDVIFMSLFYIVCSVPLITLGASTAALEDFCSGTKLYTCNADRFRQIVDRVEARHIPPERIAEKTKKILQKRNPGFAYAINRNPLLLLLNILPKGLQLWAIRLVLK